MLTVIVVHDVQFRLMDLPAEIRLNILEMCSIDLYPTCFVVVGAMPKGALDDHLVRISRIWPWRLICASSTIKREFETVFIKLIRQRIFAVQWGSLGIDEAHEIHLKAGTWVQSVLQHLAPLVKNGQSPALRIQLLLNVDAMASSEAVQSMWMRAHCPGSMVFPVEQVQLGFIITEHPMQTTGPMMVIERMRAVREKSRQVCAKLSASFTPRMARKELVKFSDLIQSTNKRRRHALMTGMGMQVEALVEFG